MPDDLHFALARADRHAAFATEVAGKLRERRWRIFDPGQDLVPGDDRDRVLADRLARARCVVVLASEASEDVGLHADVVQALRRRQEDPLGCRVVPVCREDGELSAIRGLSVFVSLPWTDAKAVADGLDAAGRKAGLLWVGKDPIAVSLVAVAADLGAEADAVEKMLLAVRSRVQRVIRVEPGQARALERAKEAPLRVLLVGAATGGGAETMLHLVDDPDCISAKLEPINEERVDRFEDQYSEARKVRKRISLRFPDANTAAEALRPSVTAWLKDHLPPPPEGNTEPESWERTWMEECAPGWENGRSGGILSLNRACNVDRAALYVSLHAGPGPWRMKDGRVVIRKDKPERGEPEEDQNTPIFLDQLLSLPDLRHVVVEGEAGTGKTVLLQHVAWTLCCKHTARPLPDHHLDLEALAAGAPLLPIPLWLEARHLARALGQVGDGGALVHAISECFQGRTTPEGIAEGLRTGRYLLLVDSLDEVPTVAGRKAVVQLLEGIAACKAHRCRVVLTTRPAAHTGVGLPRGYRVVPIAPLSPDRVEALVRRFCAAQVKADQETPLLAAITGLGQRFPTDEKGRSPLENPLLLTCLMLVFFQEKRLPDNTADLYARMVRILCESKPDPEEWDAGRRKTSEQRQAMLQRIALTLQEAGGASSALGPVLEALVRAGDARTRPDAEGLVDRLVVCTGILLLEEAQGARSLRFWHRSFQEYLAACEIASGRESVDACARRLCATERPVALDPAWEGCLRFAVGAFGQRGTEKARGFVETLVGEATRSPGPREGRLLGLAAAGVAEYTEEYFTAHPLRTDLPRMMADRFQARGASWPWRDRVLALDALGRLGDPRLPDPRESLEGWVEVGAGPYRIGGDKAAWNSLPAQTVDLPGIWMRRHPVTVGEYAVFVDEKGYEKEEFWEGRPPDEPLPRDWLGQLRVPNHPVTGISWYEARAFCRWATGRWRLPFPGLVDLPTSREWEAAARGHGKGPYPWGPEEPGEGDDARANYQWGTETPDRTTAVGAFPRGHAHGFWDLAGNLWEWCATLWQDGDKEGADCRLGDKECHPGDTDVALAPRVVRGGAWVSVPGYLRCANRDVSHPRYRGRSLGFRVVCVSVPQHGP